MLKVFYRFSQSAVRKDQLWQNGCYTAVPNDQHTLENLVLLVFLLLKKIVVIAEKPVQTQNFKTPCNI